MQEWQRFSMPTAMSMSRVLLCMTLFCCATCGNVDELVFDPQVATQLPPVISRVDPTHGRAGDSITILGFGFSLVPEENIVHCAGTTALADSYSLVIPPVDGELEQLTFTIPATAATGVTTTFLSVYDNTSNADIAFTVDP